MTFKNARNVTNEQFCYYLGICVAAYYDWQKVNLLRNKVSELVIARQTADHVLSFVRLCVISKTI